MQDLAWVYRCSYVLAPYLHERAPDDVSLIVRDAHRVLRNAVAVAMTLHEPWEEEERVVLEIEEAIDNADRAVEDAPEAEWPAPVLSEAQKRVMAAFAARLIATLDEGFDEQWHPRERLAAIIKAHIETNRDVPQDAVFRAYPDGSVNLAHPRMPLSRVHERLCELRTLLDTALARGIDVAVDNSTY
jgi:hypothetical protein